MSFGHERNDVSSSVDELYNSDDNYTLPFFAVKEGSKAWYSFKGYHAMPTYLNTLNNAILRATIPPEDANQSTLYGIYYIVML